jgi:hypothetical protein
MKSYTIVHRASPPRLDPRDDAYWADVPQGTIDQIPWPAGCADRRTVFRAVWCADALCLRYDCEDCYISAVATQTNGPVWLDSCVEFFVAPNPAKPDNYYNFEMNCVGTFLMGTHCDWNEGYADRSRDISIRVATTVPGPTKEEAPGDNGWSLVARIPWEHFQHDAPHLPPQPGDAWRANFYRVGGRTERLCSAWSPIDHPTPQFHVPRCFSRIEFAGPA